MSTIFLSIGIAGMCCILFGFLMVQTHRWSQDDTAYDLTNAVGSLLLVINAATIRAWPFFILNSIWFLYSLRDLACFDTWSHKKSKKQMRRAG